MKNVFKIIPLCGIALLLGILTSEQALAQKAVVINATNTYSASEEDMKKVVKRMFLKQQSEWPNGIEVKCFDRAKASAEQKAFNADVLGMEDAVIARHWLNLKQTTGETPPRNVGSTNILGKFIAKYDGALGVVKESDLDSLPDNVKVLFKF